jgi:hypothetical protein
MLMDGLDDTNKAVLEAVGDPQNVTDACRLSYEHAVNFHRAWQGTDAGPWQPPSETEMANARAAEPELPHEAQSRSG